MFLNGMLQMQLVNRLMDKYGYDDERVREYKQYAEHCIVDYNAWQDFNEMLSCLTDNYGKLVIE